LRSINNAQARTAIALKNLSHYGQSIVSATAKAELVATAASPLFSPISLSSLPSLTMIPEQSLPPNLISSSPAPILKPFSPHRTFPSPSEGKAFPTSQPSPLADELTPIPSSPLAIALSLPRSLARSLQSPAPVVQRLVGSEDVASTDNSISNSVVQPTQPVDRQFAAFSQSKAISSSTEIVSNAAASPLFSLISLSLLPSLTMIPDQSLPPNSIPSSPAPTIIAEPFLPMLHGALVEMVQQLSLELAMMGLN
jgi:hypothetical protein